jgi:adenylate cyclase
MVITYLAGASFLWQTERRSKRQVRAAFGKYVAPAVVSRIAENPKLLTLSGETRNLTILFSDLRNFSTISERLTATQVARFLNLYLTPMTDTILRFDGTVDKYIGDAIVAFWNAPLDVPDHTTRAVEAALAMREALAAFNAHNRAQPEDAGLVLDVRMGIGLNYGACSVGNMGSTQRFDYSALGDPVNVAARLEALTKTYGVDLLSTLAVVERTPDHAWLEIEEVKVKGRSGATRLYVLAGSRDFAKTQAFIDWSARNAHMREASRAFRHLEAAEVAESLAADLEPNWRPLYQILARGHRDRGTTDAPERVSAASEAMLSKNVDQADLVIRA